MGRGRRGRRARGGQKKRVKAEGWSSGRNPPPYYPGLTRQALFANRLCPPPSPRFDKGMGSNALLAASAPFTVQDKCVLEAEEACYVLGIESAMPIFAVRGQGEGLAGGERRCFQMFEFAERLH